MDPEAHLRGFLKVFEHTPVFKDAFDELDEGMKSQIRAFVEGGAEGVVFEGGGVSWGGLVRLLSIIFGS